MLPSESAIVEALAHELDSSEPPAIVQRALAMYSPEVVVSFSGAEDVVLIDMASRCNAPFRVVTLDTGRLHPETYRFLDLVREHYGVAIECYSPQALALEQFVHAKGLFSFYRDGHQECCAIRKVEPLGRALAGARAYLTGQRQDQSPATRGLLPVVQDDGSHRSIDGTPLVKFNPLSNWSSAQVWRYITENGVPFNELHARGFRSVGCEPCTRPTNPSQHEREGRWWWEEATKRECGIHLPGE
jgi:phosphoadenosine phosphosulfate reductase